MFEEIRQLLDADTPSLGKLEAALAKIDLAALREAQARIAAERQGLLLTGTSEQVLQAEQRLASARIDVERAETAQSALEYKIHAARAQQREADYAAAHGRALGARQAWAEKAGRELGRIDKAMNAIFDDAEQVAAQIRALHTMRQPHQFSGDAIDVMPFIPMPGEEFAAGDKVPPWLTKRLRGLPQA